MRRAQPRWALSFADLCLLLLGFMILLQARPDGVALAGGLRQALGPADAAHTEQPAVALFDSGEAILNAKGSRLVADFARTIGDRRVHLTSHGTDAGGARFDGWELAAARTAAVARALQAAKVPADHVALSIDGSAGGGQKIALETE